MTQSFSFQEPEATVIPGSSSDKGKQRRGSDNTTGGIYVNLLQPGGRSVRLPTDSVQSMSPLGQCPVGPTNNPAKVGGRKGYYTRMVERGSHGIPMRAPGVDAGFDGTTNYSSTNAATQWMTENARVRAAAHVHAHFYTTRYIQHLGLGDTYGGVPGVHAFTNIDALFSLGRGPLASISSLRLAAPGMNLQYNPGISLHTPTPYPQRTQLNSSSFDSVPALSSGSTAGDHLISSVGNQKFGSTSEPVALAFGDGHGSNHSRPQLLDRQIDSAEIVNKSQSSIYDSSLGMADDGIVMPERPSTPPALQRINTVLSDAQEEYLQEMRRINAIERGMENTPDRRSRGRQLAYTAEAQPPAEDVIAGGVSIGAQGDANGLTFDLNEVPGYTEATPKRRRKYHPIVAKDKRTYKKRKVDGNHQAVQSKKPGLNVEHDTAVCDCEACIKLRLERRGRELGHEAGWGNADALPFTSEANGMAFSLSADARNTAVAGDVPNFARSPVSPLKSYNRSCLGTPPSSSKSPTVRRNLFATQPPAQEQQPALSCSSDVAATGLNHGNAARNHHCTVGEKLPTWQEILNQQKETTIQQNQLYQRLESYKEFNRRYGEVHNEIERIQETHTNSSNLIPSVNRGTDSSLSRLCPRGILNPQEISFRDMDNKQRVQYLTDIFSKQQDMTPELLLLHIRGHLPESEKQDFTTLWHSILPHMTNDEMRQLAQMELLGDDDHPPQFQTALEMRKPTKAAKKPSKKELARSPNAMTLWPDLMQEQSNSKPAKERRGRKANNVDYRRQEGQSGNSNMKMAIVPFENRAIVPYTGQFDLLRKSKPRAKVVLDTETIRVWKLLMQGAPDSGTDAENDLNWEVERRKMEERAFLFIDRMHIVQGNRAFSPWKGSVVDAVVGAFLTQNVNDVLSSSAFMAMRAHFRNDFEPHLQKSQEPQRGATANGMPLPIETRSAAEQSQMAATMKNSVSALGFQGTANGTAETTGERHEMVEAGNVKGKEKGKRKTGLTGPERAMRQEALVSPSNNFDFADLQAEFHPKVAGQARPPAPSRAPAPSRPEATKDCVDWEAVRKAPVEEVADVIKERGLNWILAGRIKAFLARMHQDYGELDLEWLRNMPSDQTKDFLLSIRGLGLKSVECIRLLTLHHLAFPVDTNVGRICVRLGWVPLQPLPEALELHLLEMYPVQTTIQKYLWPRLCKLDQEKLYELHFQLITFGKVFCTKTKPNCNACPMRPECKHYASAMSSAKLALPAPERPNNGPTLALPPGTEKRIPEARNIPEPARLVSQYVSEPIVEEPMTPESDVDIQELTDIEDLVPFRVEEVDQEEAEILSMCARMQKSTIVEPEPALEIFMEADPVLQQVGIHSDSCVIKIVDSNRVDEVSAATQPTSDILAPASIVPSQDMVVVAPGAASRPIPKLKNVSRLRTVHYVYELPDHHPLLHGLNPREDDDPCPYLLAICGPGEVPECIPNINDSTINVDSTYASSSSDSGEESIKATLLVPCRTAMKGSFPLNGTYFQVNEVFADHKSSLQPILVPRKLLSNLRRRFVFFGTTVTSIFRGMTVNEIQACFWRGYVCVRGFDQITRAPRPLVTRLHLHPGKSLGKGAYLDA